VLRVLSKEVDKFGFHHQEDPELHFNRGGSPQRGRKPLVSLRGKPTGRPMQISSYILYSATLVHVLLFMHLLPILSFDGSPVWWEEQYLRSSRRFD
jgi:hypothetical protein